MGPTIRTKIAFEQLSSHCWADTAEGDSNSSVIIGNNCIIVSDAIATPTIAQDLIKTPRIWTAERDLEMWGELQG